MSTYDLIVNFTVFILVFSLIHAYSTFGPNFLHLSLAPIGQDMKIDESAYESNPILRYRGSSNYYKVGAKVTII